MITLGVIADTHIPDRRRNLHPEVIPTFQNANVDHILHAGDISVPHVLAQLKEIAPVHAVRGNRDWWRLKHLPLTMVVGIQDVRIGLIHGHGSFRAYIKDKLYILRGGPMPYRIIRERAVSLLPDDVDVIVFGHNHSPYNHVHEGTLVFNPGSACCPSPRHSPPSVGLLYIDGEEVVGEIINLTRIRL
jgi:hypothetical protein